MTTQEFNKEVEAFVLAYRSKSVAAVITGKLFRKDRAWDEWLEENLDKFASDDEEIAFRDWKPEGSISPKECDEPEEVEMLWEEYSRLRKDGEPAAWITVNGNHIPLDADAKPIGGQLRALGRELKGKALTRESARQAADNRDYKKIRNAKAGEKFEELGGLTKQLDYSGYHGTHAGNILNAKLRKGEKLGDSEKTTIRVMDSKMEKTSSPVEVDREVSADYLKSVGLDIKQVKAEDLEGLAGREFTDAGYGSASYRPHEVGTSYYGTTGKTVHMKVFAPEGTPMYLTTNDNEDEVTIGRGQRYRIDKVYTLSKEDKRFRKTVTDIMMDVQIIGRKAKTDGGPGSGNFNHKGMEEPVVGGEFTIPVFDAFSTIAPEDDGSYVREDKKSDDEEGRWVTTEEGHHVHINAEGKPDKGNPHVLKVMKSGASEGTDRARPAHGVQSKKTSLTAEQRKKYSDEFDRIKKGFQKEREFQKSVNPKVKDYDPTPFRESERRAKLLKEEWERLCSEMPAGTLITKGTELYEKKDDGQWERTTPESKSTFSNSTTASFVGGYLDDTDHYGARFIESTDEAEQIKDIDLHDSSIYGNWASDLNSKEKKDLVKRAKKDPEFKELVDSIVLYTEGGYVDQRKALEEAAKTSLKDVSAQTVGEYADGSFYKIRDLWKGQGIKTSDASLAGGMVHLTGVINNSEPTGKELYRVAQDRNIAKVGDFEPYVPPKPGDVIKMTAPTSFTDSKAVEEDLAGRKMGDIIHYVLEPGAKAVNVAALSRYKQSEYLSSGSFEVVSVDTQARKIPIMRGEDITAAARKRGVKEDQWGNKYCDLYTCTITLKRVGDIDLTGKQDSEEGYLTFDEHFEKRMVRRPWDMVVPADEQSAKIELIRRSLKQRRTNRKKKSIDFAGGTGTVKLTDFSRGDDEEWVTINGTHVLIDDETGEMVGGPANLKAAASKEKGKKAVQHKAIRAADSKCQGIRKKFEEAEKAKKEWDLRKWRASQSYEDAKWRQNSAEEKLKKAQKEADRLRSGRTADQIDSDIRSLEEETDRLSEWIESHPRKEGESLDDRHERMEMRSKYYDAVDRFLKCKDEKYALQELEKAKKSYDDASAKTKEMEELFEDISKADPSKGIQQLRDEYEQHAKERNAAVLQAYPTADDCDTPQAVTDYLRAREYFDQSGGYLESDRNTDLTKMSAERAVVQVKQLDRFFGDYPGLKGKFHGIECHDMSNESGYENAYGYANGTQISLNEAYYGPNGKIGESYERDCNDWGESNNGFHPKGTSFEAIVDHELTHAIEALLNDRIGGKEKVSDIVMRMAQEKIEGYYAEENEDYARALVSGYSRKNKGVNPDGKGGFTIPDGYEHYGRNTEFLAEAMADARNNPMKASKYSRAVREILEELMRKEGLI